MGDISNETSMEDILSSIKRIIAEEGEGSAQALRGRKSIRTAQAAREMEPREIDDRDEVLELNESVAAPPPPPVREGPRAERARFVDPVPEPEPVPAPPLQSATPDATIVSERVAEASRGSLDQLSRMFVRAETPGADSLEGLVRELLRPMLRDWLDAKLPGIVEAMVAREIARISGRE